MLTDGALEALPDLTGDHPRRGRPPDRLRRPDRRSRPPTATTTLDETRSDPLAKDVDQEGARFNSGKRRQTFEPTPLGFAIQNETGGDESNARQYDVDRAAWEAAGGRTAGDLGDSGEPATPRPGLHPRRRSASSPLGSGQIRIAGALLPQPSEEFDHPLGLEPYATTYTGYILICNLLDCTVS